MKYTSYIWDFDGTLCDSYPHTAAAFGEILAREQIEFDAPTLFQKLSDSFRTARTYYAMSDAVYEDCCVHALSWSVRPAMTLFPGTAAVLRAICEAGGQNFLYTHRDRTAWTALRLFGLDKYFSGGVDATMHFPPKPAPDAVEHICHIYQLDKANTLMVGDREIDVLSGVNAGVDACLFFSHPVEEKESAARFSVRSMTELAAACEITLHETDMLSAEAAQALREQAAAAAKELCTVAKLSAGQTVVVGCSSSEITGERIGSSSSPEAADAVFDGLMQVFAPRGIHLAAQCCEHLNRALIVERAAAHAMGAQIMNVVPMPKAGGAFAFAAWRKMEDPVAIDAVQADAGLDIGGTMIGMHLRRVAVPLRLSICQIGQASLAAARVRPPFAGGERAVYNDAIL